MSSLESYRRFVQALACSALICTALPYSAAAWSEPLRIAVAANFKPTLESINSHYTAQTGVAIKLSSASTGVLATQLLYGAPFDLFLAADTEQPKVLAGDRSHLVFCYAMGRLVLVGGSIEDLANPTLSLAIANPVTAPYGRAATEVIARDAFAAASDRKVVRANNAAQAYQFWYSGAVDLALLPLAFVPREGHLIPRDWHKPIAQHAFIAKSSTALVRYLNWFRSDTVRSLILEAGYESCP